MAIRGRPRQSTTHATGLGRDQIWDLILTAHSGVKQLLVQILSGFRYMTCRRPAIVRRWTAVSGVDDGRE